MEYRHIEQIKDELSTILDINKEDIYYNVNVNNWDIFCGKIIILNEKMLQNNLMFLPLRNVHTDFICRNLGLKSLINSPEYVLTFDCSYNDLETLQYAPSRIGNFRGYFICSHNKLKSLQYVESINYHYSKFDCSYNKIERLDFNIDCETFYVHHNKITYISDDVDITKFSLYKNPYYYFKKYNYEYN